ncbi:MAG: alpha/beta hydrolase [Chloroflexi bacterium]|nr:alpha/beta hydrolase [Chloroflexota bacterium]
MPAATPTAQVSPTPAPVVVTATLNLTYSVPITALVDSYALDVYAPVGGQGLPIVVFLHGTGETKRGYSHFSQSTAAAGFVVYVADWPVYTLSRATQDNGRGYREVTEIVACAVRFARATAATYGGDASKVTLGGFSAGAATAALVAFLGDEPERAWDAYAAKAGGPPPQARCTQTGNSAHVDAFVGAAGPYNLSTPPRGVDAGVAELVTLAPRVDSRRGLKVRLVHGTADSLVPLESSVRFAEALKAANYDVKLTRFDGPHAAPEALLIAQLRDLWPR